MSLAKSFSSFFTDKVDRISQEFAVWNVPEGACELMLHPAAESAAVFDEFEILTSQQVCELHPVKSSEIDILPAAAHQSVWPSLSPFVTTLISLSLLQGNFPDSFKTSLVKPLLKGSDLDSSNPKSYRPVSNLSFISKVLETTVKFQLLEFLQENSLLHPISWPTDEPTVLKLHY